MSRAAIHEARDQAIAQRYRDGATMEAVGAVHGITRGRVHQILVRLGVERRHGDEAMSADGRARRAEGMRAFSEQMKLASKYRLLEKDRERNDAIIALRKQAVGPREIARRLGLTPNVVAGVLHRAGLCTEERGRGFAVHESIKRAAVRDALSGTYAAAAAKYGVCVPTIAAWVRAA